MQALTRPEAQRMRDAQRHVGGTGRGSMLHLWSSGACVENSSSAPTSMSVQGLPPLQGFEVQGPRLRKEAHVHVQARPDLNRVRMGWVHFGGLRIRKHVAQGPMEGGGGASVTSPTPRTMSKNF